MRLMTGLLLIFTILASGINSTQAAGKCDQPPIAVNDRAILYGRLTNITIPILQNDSDPGQCRFHMKQFTRGGRGQTRFTGEGIWYSYQGLIQPLTDSFTYTIENSAGKTATATVDILLYPQNLHPPVTQDETITSYPKYYQDIDVLNNDIDPDGAGTGLGLSVTAINFDKSKLGAAIFKYHPREISVEGYEPGQYSLTYTVLSNATGLTATGTLHVNIIPAPPPIANEDTITVKPGQRIQIDVLKNDVPGIQDIPQSRRRIALTIVGLDQTQSQPAQGKVNFIGLDPRTNRYLKLVYTANRNATGVDVFYYILRERFGVTAVGKVTVIIQP